MKFKWQVFEIAEDDTHEHIAAVTELYGKSYSLGLQVYIRTPKSWTNSEIEKVQLIGILPKFDWKVLRHDEYGWYLQLGKFQLVWDQSWGEIRLSAQSGYVSLSKRGVRRVKYADLPF